MMPATEQIARSIDVMRMARVETSNIHQDTGWAVGNQAGR
jgi:hypothetical protein